MKGCRLFSIIIPTLNRSEKLGRALASASQQSLASEIIVVDDGSSADEAAIIKALVETYPRAKLVRHVTNQGAGVARNSGVTAASGEIVAFLDSDDWWMPERLERHMPIFCDPSIVLSHNRAWITRGSDTEKTYGRMGRRPPRRWSTPVALAAWNYVGGCSLVCVRRSAFLDAGGFDPTLAGAEDWDLWIRLSALGTFHFVDETLGFYDAGPHERLTTSENKIVGAHERLFEIARALPKGRRERRYVKAVHHYVHSEIASQFGHALRSIKELLLSLSTMPTKVAFLRMPFLFARAVQIQIQFRRNRS
ncbi:glycosyltransferase family 2 protein [Novosphingobium sp. 11B]